MALLSEPSLFLSEQLWVWRYRGVGEGTDEFLKRISGLFVGFELRFFLLQGVFLCAERERERESFHMMLKLI